MSIILQTKFHALNSHTHTIHPYKKKCKKKCSIIFCEAVAIYGVIVAIILQTKIDAVAGPPFSSKSVFAGYAIFGSGLTTGFGNLACG